MVQEQINMFRGNNATMDPTSPICLEKSVLILTSSVELFLPREIKLPTD